MNTYHATLGDYDWLKGIEYWPTAVFLLPPNVADVVLKMHGIALKNGETISFSIKFEAKE